MAQPNDAFAALEALLPEKSDSAAEAQRKRAELARILAAHPDHPLKAKIELTHAWAAVGIAVFAENHGLAREAFERARAPVRREETSALALLDLIADAARQVAHSSVEHEDRNTAEAAFTLLQDLLERAPTNRKLVLAAATAAGATANLYAGAGDARTVAKAEAYANAIIRLPALESEEDRDACAKALTWALASIVQGFLRVQSRDRARLLVWQTRRVLFAPPVRAALTESRDARFAEDMHGMFGALMQGYLTTAEPDEDRAGFGAVLDDDAYEFASTRGVTCWSGIAIDLPARWVGKKTKHGRWVFDEDEARIESGTLWVDYDLLPWPSPMPVPGSEAFDEGLGARMLRATPDGDPPVESALRRVGAEKVYYMRNHSPENEEWLKIHAWRRAGLHQNSLVLVSFSLVVLAFLAWREDFKALVRQVEAAIGQAEIDGAGLIVQRTRTKG